MTIAFHDMGNPDWSAGKRVLELLAHAMRAGGPECPQLLLSVWSNKDPEEYAELSRLFDGIIRLPAGETDPERLAGVFRASGAEVLFSLPTEFAAQLPMPRILWIYDFQHLHHPGNFPEVQRQRMDRLFRENAASATLILAYSDSLLRDIQTYLPEQMPKVRSIRFVPDLPDSAWEARPGELSGLPGLPDRFFYVPNRFYPYKNHAIVIQALARLKALRLNPAVVFTGAAPAEYADAPDTLLRLANESGVANQVVIPGLVPRNAVFALMRRSVAIINPSQFEGFGISVAEATAMEKPLILSDLPVLHEHAAPNARYFHPADADSLAMHMADLWKSDTATPGPGRTTAARERHENATLQFGRNLCALFAECAHVPNGCPGILRPPTAHRWPA